MLKKLSFASGLRGSSASGSSASGFQSKGEKGKVVKYSYTSSKRSKDDDDDDLDEVAVISNATPENVTYGDRCIPASSVASGSHHHPGGNVYGMSSNGPPPRIVPGIITSTGFESKPYVPATCSMQPKISSSVIQSTAGSRGSGAGTTSSSGRLGGVSVVTSSPPLSSFRGKPTTTVSRGKSSYSEVSIRGIKGGHEASSSTYSADNREEDERDVTSSFVSFDVRSKRDSSSLGGKKSKDQRYSAGRRHQGVKSTQRQKQFFDDKEEVSEEEGDEDIPQEADRLLPSSTPGSHEKGIRGKRVNESGGSATSDSQQKLPIQTISSKVTTTSERVASSSLKSIGQDASSEQEQVSPSAGKRASSTSSPSTTANIKASTAIFTSKSSGSPGFMMSIGADGTREGGLLHPAITATGSPSLNNAHQVVVSKKLREQRRKEIKKELEKSWTTGSPSGASIEKSGCNWSFVFDPSGRLVYYWSMIVSLAFVYNAWVIIYRFAFDEINASTALMWLSMDFTADIIYLLDVMIHFRIGYLEEGVLQTHPAKLRQHYMNSTIFYIDCLCLLPLDFLYLSTGFNSIFRCFRLGGFGSTDWFSGSRDSKSCSDVDCDYLHAFYWSTLALTTIGDLPRPRTKGEYIFLIIELVLGLFLLATVLGHVANIVTNVSAARKEFQAKLDSVKTYMRMRRVPEHLKIKVIKWFDYLWMTQKSSDEEKSVGFLPAKLKAEIAIHVHLDTLKRVEIFQNTEAGFLCALVLRLKPVLFSPSDYVCRKGEIGKEMYIVNRGKLQVVADNGKTVLATLRAGSYFGEISILNMGTAGNRRTASVRSVGYSDLFCLNKNDMWDVLKDYPAARVRLEAIAVKRLEKYRKEPLKKISMGRSRSTPGLTDSKSQLNVSTAVESGETNNNQGKETTNDSEEKRENERLPILSCSSTTTSFSNNNRNSQDLLDRMEKQSSLPPPPQYSFLTHQTTTSATTAFNQSSHLIHSTSLLYPEAVTITMPSSSTPARTYPSIGVVTPATPSSVRQSDDSWHQRRTSSPQIPVDPVNITGNLEPSSSFPPLGTSSPRTPIPGEVSQEVLIQEIKRLRQRLHSVETENVSMTLMLSQQQSLVESRLAEIESHINSRGNSCRDLREATAVSSGTTSQPVIMMPAKGSPKDDEEEQEDSKIMGQTSSSSTSSTPTSGEDSERNKESII